MKCKTTILIGLFSIAALAAACTSPATVKKGPENAGIVNKAHEFYSFLEGREMGNRHNDRDRRFREFFPSVERQYDFLDSYLPLVRDRNFMYNRYHAYYIQDVKMAQGGEAAEVRVKLYSRDAPLLYRKLVMTQKWFRTSDTWHPGKADAKKLNRWTRLTRLYALPPKIK